MRAICFAFGLLALSTPLATAKEPIKWTLSRHGGSAIEIPVFIADGNTRLLKGGGKYGLIFDSKEYGVEFSQYKVVDGSNKRPIEYVYDQAFPRGSSITYELDKPFVGAVSVEIPGKISYIYYNMCRKTQNATVCFDISSRKKDQELFGPIVERIVKSFRKNR